MSNIKNFTRTDTNPFILQLKGKMYLQPRANTIVAKNEAIIDVTTNTVLRGEQSLLGRRKIVDKSEFAKIYFSELATIMGLSKTALNVLIFLMQKMDYDNKVLFQYTSEYKKVGYNTKGPCYKGISELLKSNIIALHIIEGVYWVNPIYVCKGERFAKYTEYVTEEYAEREKQQILEIQRDEQKKALNEIQYKKDAMDLQESGDIRKIKDLENELEKLKNKIQGTKTIN